jgi:chromosome segregation ATPase
VVAETQTDPGVDELLRDNNNLRHANRELELQVSGYEKTHRLTMTHIRSLEDENMKLRLTIDASAYRQDLVGDMKILQDENAVLHERLLASSHRMSQLLSRVDDLQRKVRAVSASEGDVHRARAMGAFIEGMETVRRNALKKSGALGEFEALRRRLAEAEKAMDAITARLESLEHERDEWKTLAGQLGDRIAAINGGKAEVDLHAGADRTDE